MSTEEIRESALGDFESEYDAFWKDWEEQRLAGRTEIDEMLRRFPNPTDPQNMRFQREQFEYDAAKEAERTSLQAEWDSKKSALGDRNLKEAAVEHKQFLSPGLQKQTMLNPLFTGK